MNTVYKSHEEQPDRQNANYNIEKSTKLFMQNHEQA